MFETDKIYIVAGDEMQRLFREKWPGCRTIPFREDLSQGSHEDFALDDEMIRERAAFWHVTPEEYGDNMKPIIDLDMSDDYVLVFGRDECCRANLEFMLGHLRYRGHDKPIQVKIVDEYDLTVLDEYEA